MRPTENPELIYQEIRPVGVKPVLIEDAVRPRDVPFEVAEELGFHLQLVLELAERRDGIDRDGQDLDAVIRELIEILGEANELLGTGAGESEGKEGEQYISLPAKRIESDV